MASEASLCGSKELAAHIDEEANDHEGYMKIAELAESEGCCHEASEYE